MAGESTGGNTQVRLNTSSSGGSQSSASAQPLNFLSKRTGNETGPITHLPNFGGPQRFSESTLTGQRDFSPTDHVLVLGKITQFTAQNLQQDAGNFFHQSFHTQTHTSVLSDFRLIGSAAAFQVADLSRFHYEQLFSSKMLAISLRSNSDGNQPHEMFLHKNLVFLSGNPSTQNEHSAENAIHHNNSNEHASNSQNAKDTGQTSFQEVHDTSNTSISQPHQEQDSNIESISIHDLALDTHTIYSIDNISDLSFQQFTTSDSSDNATDPNDSTNNTNDVSIVIQTTPDNPIATNISENFTDNTSPIVTTPSNYSIPAYLASDTNNFYFQNDPGNVQVAEIGAGTADSIFTTLQNFNLVTDNMEVNVSLARWNATDGKLPSLATFDTNHDGKLTGNEVTSALGNSYSTIVVDTSASGANIVDPNVAAYLVAVQYNGLTGQLVIAAPGTINYATQLTIGHT